MGLILTHDFGIGDLFGSASGDVIVVDDSTRVHLPEGSLLIPWRKRLNSLHGTIGSRYIIIWDGSGVGNIQESGQSQGQEQAWLSVQ